MRVLQENRYRRLILLGDIFADLNFGRLKKEHWKFLGFIRKLSNPKRNVEVVWVEGNHDHGLAEIMSHLVGVRVYQEYQWEYQGLRHTAVHGHQFDGFVVSNVRVSYLIGTLLYLQLQKWDSKNKTLTRFLDRLNTRWLRLSSKVADGALAHARHRQAARIFCGHTHAAMHKHERGTDYFNCGSWIDAHPTHITVGEEGVQIHEYVERPDDRHSGEERSPADSEPANSLARQDYSKMASTRVLVADANSTDGTPEVVMSFRDRLKVEVISGGMPSAGRNNGARLADTKYVLFLDADIELASDSLIRTAVEAAQRKDLHCVTTNILCPDGSFTDKVFYVGNDFFQYLSCLHRPFSTGMFMMFELNKFRELGGFDERIRFAEDYRLSSQVQRRRFKIVRGGVHTTNRRFQRMGHLRVGCLFLWTALNFWNEDYFLRDHHYWADGRK